MQSFGSYATITSGIFLFLRMFSSLANAISCDRSGWFDFLSLFLLMSVADIVIDVFNIVVVDNYLLYT